MLTSSQWVALAVAIGATAAIAAGAYRLGRRWRLDQRHAATGAAIAAALAGLAATDLAFPAVGAWWAARPMLAASLSGVLFVALTVIYIEAIIDRSSWYEAWRLMEPQLEGLQRALGSLALHQAADALKSAPRPLSVAGSTDETWLQRPDVQGALDHLDAAAAAMNDLVGELRTDLLVAGKALHPVYEAAIALRATARGTRERIARFRRELTVADDLLLLHGRSQSGPLEERARFVEWLWNDVGLGYNRLVRHATLLSTRVTDIVAAREPGKVKVVFAIPDENPSFWQSDYLYSMRKANPTP